MTETAAKDNREIIDLASMAARVKHGTPDEWEPISRVSNVVDTWARLKKEFDEAKLALEAARDDLFTEVFATIGFADKTIVLNTDAYKVTISAPIIKAVTKHNNQIIKVIGQDKFNQIATVSVRDLVKYFGEETAEKLSFKDVTESRKVTLNG